MNILVAMSGGVDSSVVAHKLQEEGHNLVGVMMKLWTDPLAPEVRRAIPTKCCSIEHVHRARSTCSALDIPFYVINLEEEFKTKVVDPFLQSYSDGETPNPCIECNKHIKFGTLHKTMEELQCQKVATGHYARIQMDQDGNYRLLEAVDKAKDQSYYLYGLSQDILKDVLLPLGECTKEDTFALAKKFGVPLQETYRESQDLCFFPEKDPKAFLQRYIPMNRGKILKEDGTCVGEHNGLPLYTIGQRKGLGIGGLKIPLHVVRKEQKSNTIFVAEDGADMKSHLSANHVHWIRKYPDNAQSFPVHARISSLGKKYRGIATLSQDMLHIAFDCPIRGIAPGQSVVLYQEDEVVGGGVIVL